MDKLKYLLAAIVAVVLLLIYVVVSESEAQATDTVPVAEWNETQQKLAALENELEWNKAQLWHRVMEAKEQANAADWRSEQNWQRLDSVFQ